MIAAYQLMLADLEEVAPGLAPQSCWSAGSIITNALRHAGVRAPIDSTATLPPWVLRCLRLSFPRRPGRGPARGRTHPHGHGGPERHLSAMFSLLGLTRHLAADRFEHEDVPVEEVEALFAPDGFRDRLDDREWWARIGSLFVQVEPHGELLPCVREAGERWRSVTAPLDLAAGTIWLHAADLVWPTLDGRCAKLGSACPRVVPVGTAPGLDPVRLPSGQRCDLTRDDYGQFLVRERQVADAIEDLLVRCRRVAMAKMVSVSGGWGVFGRVDQRQVASAQESVGFGPEGQRLVTRGRRVEQAGPLTQWHIASAIPAACRAVIGMAQHDVETAGRTVARRPDRLHRGPGRLRGPLGALPRWPPSPPRWPGGGPPAQP